jgi:hypothetical protein
VPVEAQNAAATLGCRWRFQAEVSNTKAAPEP